MGVDVKLSILIPTLRNRGDQRSRLLAQLWAQLQNYEQNEIEILIECDEGELPTGTKRNLLLEQARGEYVVFIDDDDEVSTDYVEQLMDGINLGVDLVAIQGIRTVNGAEPRPFVDVPYTSWATAADGTFLRGVQHLDAIKRSIARDFKFPTISFGEDQAWGRAIEAAGRVRSWHAVSKPIYFYRDRSPKVVRH